MKEEKKIKVIKTLSMILLMILVLELIYFCYKYYRNRENSTYYSITNDLVVLDDSYIGVGLSDFKHSKYNKISTYNKATIWKYDDNFKVLEEHFIDLGYNGYFNSIVKIDDGYVAVGALEMTETQHEEETTEGLIVRFDNDLNVVWRKNIQVLDDTEFVNIKLDKDNNLVVVGQSIYAKNIIGNQTTGGAMLFKFDLEGEELFRINYGGPQTGIFNDVLIEDDGYVLVGSTKNSTGIIQKYDFNGNEIWHNYYGPTDSNGLTKIVKVDNYYLVLGTILPDKNTKTEYKASIVKYNESGKKIDEILYEKDYLNKFRDILVEDNSYVLVGTYGSGNSDNDLVTTDAVYLVYDKDFNILKEDFLSLENSESYNKIYKKDNKYLVLGFTNSKYKKYKTNGYDYYSILEEYK